MSQFRSVGGLDEPISEDVDRRFFAVNQRLQLNQLQEGEVRESLNGRMEGYWKPRKGVVEKTAALTTGQTPLQLPFLLMAVESSISTATIASTTVTITTSVAHGITSGDFVSINKVAYSSGANPNGVFQVTVTNSTQFTYTLTGGVGPYTVVGAVASDLSKTISAVSYAADFVTLTVTSHGFEVGTSGNASINGLVFTGVDYNGIQELEVMTSSTLRFPVLGVTAVTLNTNPRITQLPINDVANANVRASCLFSDPNTNNKEFIIVAMDTVAKKIDLATLAITDIPYPSGQAIGVDGEMIQLFDKVMLFRDGQQALEWYPNGRPIISAVSNGTASPNTVVTVNMREHGLIAGTPITISGLTGGTPPNGTYAVVSTATQDTFTFVASGISTGTTFVVTDAIATDGFTLSAGGAYTQPQVFISDKTGVNATSGLVSLTVASNTTIRTGDIIVVYENKVPEFEQLLGNEYQVTFASSTSVQFYAPVGNLTGTGSTLQIQFGGRFSVGGGFMHQPAAPWGIHFQRRLWVPYYYDQSGPFDAPVYTSRKITDEISVSDILDTTTFDQIENQFRISGGTADYVVGMHGFYDDALVVLNRNSLHLVKGTLGSLLDCTVKELTSEIGCLARKSVVMRGNTMMFLSDDGVYSLEFLNDYNLRGSEEPISKNIQPYIDRINKNYAEEAVGILFDNRYYLAVALDSVVGANDAQGNNSVLVYNFKNQGWESLDTYGDSRFLIKNLLTGGAGIRNELYAVTRNGGLHQIDAVESSLDRLNVSNVGGDLVTTTINASLTTRGYDLKTMERKRFTDAQIIMQNLAGDTGEYSSSFAAEDPDNASLIGTTTQFLGGVVLSPSTPNEAETASIRCRLAGIRGYTGTLILTRTIGSPKINSVKVAGSVTNRQIISQK